MRHRRSEHVINRLHGAAQRIFLGDLLANSRKRARMRAVRNLDQLHGQTLFQPALDVFQHHDGIIDNDADGQDQAEQGEVVERKPH